MTAVLGVETSPSMPKQDHLSLGKIAKMCRVSRTTVYRWIINKQLKAYALPSGHFRVRPIDLSAFCRAYQIPDPYQDREVPQTTAVRIDRTGDGAASVLIADDHPDMVDVLERVVQRYLPESEVFIARNGVDTCMQVATKRPNLLLLDIMMPGMDGFTVLRELLARDELGHSHVIVVSAYDPFDRVMALQEQHEQVRACYRKPVSIEELGGTLRSLAPEAPTRTHV